MPHVDYIRREDAIAAWNRRPTNEGQEGLTDSEILTDAHRYCCKYVHADDAPYRFTERGIIEFVNLRIASHLSNHPAPDDQQAKDAARYRWLRDENAYYPEEQLVTGGEELDSLIDDAMQSAEEKV